MTIKIKNFDIPKTSNPILIEGLPGIGNVGKIAADFLVESLNAKKIYEIYSYSFPHSVFVNEENLVELPLVQIFYKKLKNKELMILAGDVQPLDERNCYEFCQEILEIFKKHKGKEIITLGGMGLQEIPQNPKVYCTANQKDIIKKYKKYSPQLKTNTYGTIGPIIGVTGLLVGLAKEEKIPAISFLAETFSHPTYLGIKGARQLLKVLQKSLSLNIKLDKLDEEIDEIEEEIKKIGLDKLAKIDPHYKKRKDITYIG